MSHTFCDVECVRCANQHLHGQGYFNSAYSKVKIRPENGKEKSEEDLKIKNKIRLPIKKINKPKQIWGGYSRCYLRKFQRTILCSFTQGQARPNTTHFSWVEVGLSPPAFHFNCFISTYLAKITDFRSTNTLPPV